MISYRFFSIITGVLISLILILLSRRSRINTTYFIWWGAIISIILIFSFFPTLIDIIGKWLGVSYPPVLISIVGLGLILIKTLSMDIYITKNEIRYKTLAQKIALLEKKLKDHFSRL